MRSTARISSHPIHPMLVAFPIGLWIASWIFDILGSIRDSNYLWAASFYCAVFGIVGALLAAVPGAIDWLTIVPPNSSAKRRGAIHGSLNTLALLLFIYIAYRQGGAANEPDKVTLLLMALGVVMLGVSGWLGGTLVYRNQI